MKHDKDLKLKVLPLGGLGEIGMNMMVLAWQQDAVIIDAGLMFPDESMPGIDLVIPDLDALLRQDWNVLGIVLTHGHEDHIGALPYVLERITAPVYATNFTMGLVESKLEEFNLLGTTTRHIVSTDTVLELGPFSIDFVAMCHSVADGVGLAVTTPAGIIMHSGDFKLDPDPIDGRVCDLEKIASYSRKGVLALFSDSTNVERSGSAGSESTIRPALARIFRAAPGRILIATFSSNIHRIQQILSLASEFGRYVVLVGRSMTINTRIAAERGYLEVPPGILVDIKDMNGLPDDKVVLLSTGSQGEPMSALSLMAYERHKYLKVKQGDLLVFSSRFIPGNEKAINHIINEFSRRGADVEYEKVSHVHVSGHAAGEELRSIMRIVRPRYFMPVHGEYRHLRRHARMAVEEGIPQERVLVAQDGDMIEISREGVEVVDHVELRRVFVDGKGVGDVGTEVLRERRVLSEVGLVTVVLAVQGTTGEVVSGPEVFSRGLTYEELEPELLDGTRKAVERLIAGLDLGDPEEWEEVRDQIRLAVRRHINRILRRKPLVQTIILQI